MITEKDIGLLSQSEHVKIRPTQFLGSIFAESTHIPQFIDGKLTTTQIDYVPACIRCINEILENSCDEFLRTKHPSPKLHITFDSSTNQITIQDNGSGIPIGLHECGLYTPEVVFCHLGSGSNFTSNKTEGLQGQNGVGSACVNFCSEYFIVDIYRDNKHYHQKYIDGTNDIQAPIIKRKKQNSGTTVCFKLNKEIFPILIPTEWIKIKCNELSIVIPNISIKLTLIEGENENTIEYTSSINTRVKNEIYTCISDGNNKITFLTNKEQYNIFGWVNGGYLFDGGNICNDAERCFVNEFINHITPIISKEKLKVSKEDILSTVNILVEFNVSDPMYDSQAKTRFKGPSQKTKIENMIRDNFKLFVKQQGPYIQDVLERVRAKSNNKAKKTMEKKQKIHFVEGYLKATGVDRSTTWLLINEGLSAASQVSAARDPKTIGSLPLGGKINNIHGCSPAQLLTMKKIVDMLQIIGLVPGKKAIRSDLHYNHVVIATDADPDGDDIFVNLVNLFYQNWPELISEANDPFLYRLCAPNIVAVTSKDRIHFQTRQDYEKNKHKIKLKYDVEYMKGLGSMTISDWKKCLSNLDSFQPIVSDEQFDYWMNIFFSDNSNLRKEWLQQCHQ